MALNNNRYKNYYESINLEDLGEGDQIFAEVECQSQEVESGSNTNEEVNETKEGQVRPLLYSFNPGPAAPELRIFTSTTSNGRLKATVRRKAFWWSQTRNMNVPGGMYMLADTKDGLILAL